MEPSQQQPAEGEKEVNFDDNPYGYLEDSPLWNKFITAYRERIKELEAQLQATAISPTEEELEREAEKVANNIMFNYPPTKAFVKVAAKDILHFASRYTRQGEQDWEALYISEHLNLLAVKERIAELEKQLALNK